MINWKLKRFISKFQDIDFYNTKLSGLDFLECEELARCIKKDEEFLNYLMFVFESKGVLFNGKYEIGDAIINELDDEYVDEDGNLKGVFLYRTFELTFKIIQDDKKYIVETVWNNKECNNENNKF